jgi:hypothetical protein
VRALLDLMRDNEAAVQHVSGRCLKLLLEAKRNLKILHPEHGDEELTMSVAVEYAKLSLSLRQPEPGGATAGMGVGRRVHGVGFRI